MFAFEGLHPGHLVGTHRLFALLRETRSVLIQGADGFDRLVAVFIDRRGQPIADEMGVEIPFFSVGAIVTSERLAPTAPPDQRERQPADDESESV